MSEPTTWQKSSFSQEGGECVELASVGGAMALRESDDPGSVLISEHRRVNALLRCIKADLAFPRPR
ncbi:DUF397 domain-containing protein [Streptomyces sp. N2-109]|uniref:DUF397 domain-containing protein n=1 Tax=Streptomyces gossypii TaxID=2883101 RepID=A0ABT2JY83_9ACTN|nr:DUF397 domain-containing protein [Streptomyces gossypii]MCT2592638.1 DUF397 domain-containing protein [Streptomyces gossypii]